MASPLPRSTHPLTTGSLLTPETVLALEPHPEVGAHASAVAVDNTVTADARSDANNDDYGARVDAGTPTADATVSTTNGGKDNSAPRRCTGRLLPLLTRL